MSGMPPPPPRPLGGDLRRAVLQAAAARAPAHGTHHGSGLRGEQEAPARDASLPLPLPWTDYFDSVEHVACPERDAVFNVYVAGTSGPVVLCLHGGGYTGLTWALLAQRLKSGCRVVAPDLRAHGLTTVQEESDLSAATLAADVVAIWRAMFGASGAAAASNGSGSEGDAAKWPADQQQQQQQQQTGAPPTVLVGHSMGGAVAVHAAALSGIPSLAGCVVIDVVEGTALASLPYMSTVLAKRPARFASLAQAVEWALDTGMCKRQEAAHISLPAMLRQEAAGEAPRVGRGAAGAQPLTATGLEPLLESPEELGEEHASLDSTDSSLQQQYYHHQQQPQQQQPQQMDTFPPEQRVAAGAATLHERPQQQRQQRGAADSGAAWVWRTRLEESAPHWEGWYTGLSDAFLALGVPKVLVLVGTDRLDRPLTIGQMQGKFQPVLLPQAGHAVHEDEPDRTAEAIATFIKRFRIGEPPLKIPRPPAGLQPVLPVAMGPACQPAEQKPA